MALDALKIHSDDSKFTEDHVIFLLNKYRAYALQQKYSKTLEGVNNRNYQTLKVSMLGNMGNRPGIGYYLFSTKEIPGILSIALPKVEPGVFSSTEIIFTSENRLRYIGYNRFLPNIVYSCIGNDNKLCLKGKEDIVKTLTTVSLNAVFANPLEADNFSNVIPDVLDREFPMEDTLVPSVLELVLKDLTNGIYKPSDTSNDAQDALSDLAGYLRRNMKSQFQKQIDE
jgi:hypothetical protein